MAGRKQTERELTSTHEDFVAWLKAHGACARPLSRVRTLGYTFQDAWRKTKNLSYRDWLATRLCRDGAISPPLSERITKSATSRTQVAQLDPDSIGFYDIPPTEVSMVALLPISGNHIKERRSSCRSESRRID